MLMMPVLVAPLRQWWECLSEIGPGYGYFVNAKKTWLVTKSSFGAAAAAQFAGTGVNVTVLSHIRPVVTG